MRTYVAILAAVLLVAAPVAEAAKRKPPPGPRPPLSHEERFFTDATGRAVFLHGFNMVYKVGSYRPEDTGFGRDDARFLRRHGFNTIRLGLIYKGLEPEPPGPDGRARYVTEYLNSLARSERVLARQRIFTLLDAHQDLYNERFQGEGWPDWQTIDDGMPAEPQNGFPANYLTMPALNRAFDHFWANDPVLGVGLVDRFAAAWRPIARRFRDRRFTIGYDILNEPWPGSPYPSCISPEGCPAFDTGPLSEFTLRVFEQIRTVDPQSLIFWEPLLTFDFGAATSHVDTGDANAGLSFHNYCLPGVFGGSGDTCEELEQRVFDNADAIAESHGDVLFLTEFSATDDAVVNERLLRLSDEHMVSWQSWHYCDCDDPTTQGPGVQSLVKDPAEPPRGDNLKRDKLAVFSRPYPQTVAGTPIEFSFDPETREFELRYSTDRLGGRRALPRRLRTEIFIPPIHYRDGYRIELEGAEATSKRNARILRLRRDRNATEVSLTLSPAN